MRTIRVIVGDAPTRVSSGHRALGPYEDSFVPADGPCLNHFDVCFEMKTLIMKTVYKHLSVCITGVAKHLRASKRYENNSRYIESSNRCSNLTEKKFYSNSSFRHVP